MDGSDKSKECLRVAVDLHMKDKDKIYVVYVKTKNGLS
jgi:hypothetical protein